jgi:hypothetical protein
LTSGEQKKNIGASTVLKRMKIRNEMGRSGLAPKRRKAAMTFVFATLAFLAATWAALVVLGLTLEDYGAKVRAALAGKSYPSDPGVPALSVRMSPRYPSRRVVRTRARPALRAAA